MDCVYINDTSLEVNKMGDMFVNNFPATIRKRGNSSGVTIPPRNMKYEGVKVGDEVIVIIKKKSDDRS